MQRILLATTLLLTAACASYQLPSAETVRPEAPFLLYLDAPQEVVFRDLADLASASDMFRVETLEPETGTLVLALSESEPSMFIDCGMYKPSIFGNSEYAGTFVDYRVKMADGRLQGLVTTIIEAGAENTAVALNADFVFADLWNEWTFDSNRMDVQRTVTTPPGPGPKRPQSGPERGCRSSRVAERVVLDFLARRYVLYLQQQSYANPGVRAVPPPKSTSVTVQAGEWGELAGRAYACGVPAGAIDSFGDRAYRSIDRRDGRARVRRNAGGLYRAGFTKEQGKAEDCDRVLVEYHAVASGL